MYRDEKAAIAILIVIVLVVAGFFGYKFYEKKQKEEMFEGMTKGELTTLLNRQNELEKEIAYINEEMKYSGTGALVVLFVQPASKLQKEAVPYFNKKGYKAVIAVSEQYFPGDENCLSVKEMKALVDDGWEIAITCTKGTDIESLCKRLEGAGLGKPAAAYYPSGRTKPDVDTLKKQGITTIIRYNIISENYLNESDDKTISVISYGCNESGMTDMRHQVMNRGETFVFEIGFLNKRNQCSNIGRWVNSLEQTAAVEKFNVSNISGAVEQEKANMKKLKEDNRELYRERSNDIRELQTVTDEIKEMEQKYR